ncbi:MAG: 2-oxo acid dehydrogenase subunit E2 [Chloroflexi bacterium]|nr:2-oxo acid dehydrogenase subunit E2 [Chloroflexota bacterium]
MSTEVIMPQMGFDMKEGTLVRWIKHEGDQVSQGDPIAEIETDKAVVEIEAFGTGVMRKHYIGEGTTVPVGQIIGVIAAPDEKIPDAPPPGSTPSAAAVAKAQAQAPMAAPAAAPAQPVAATPARTPGERVKASPLARKEAESRGLDIAQVTGTGPNGRITRDDVIRYAEQGKGAVAPARAPAASIRTAPVAPKGPALGELVPLSRMRQAIARSMTRSKQEIPHFYLTIAVDMSDAVKLRKGLNEALGGEVKVSINDMVMKAAAKALLKHTSFNAMYTENGIQVHKTINMGMAIAVEQGLVAPAILDCQAKGLVQIAKETKALTERARTGHLTAQELTGATFTVSNLGMYDVEEFTAIITPPQSGALAIGSVRKEPVVRDGQVVVADVMRITVSTDHRVSDGAQAALFGAEVKGFLENPVSLLL